MVPQVKLQRFYIGSYSTTGPYVSQACGEGISCCTLDISTGQIERISLLMDGGNFTYLSKNTADNRLFAAFDQFSLEGEVKAFRIDPTGSLELVSSIKHAGTSTCHIECDVLGKRVFASSYGDGKLFCYHFDENLISKRPQILSYTGSGPNSERQEMSHIHQAVVSPSQQWLYACDLGSDKIWVHRLKNSITEQIVLTERVETPSGSGPRHMVCHPSLDVGYVFCELNSNILTYKLNENSGSMQLTADDATLFDEDDLLPAGAAIQLHPSLNCLFVSERSNNSISTFSIDKATGKLYYKTRFSTRGKTPRDINIDPTGNWLLVANQDSDHIMPFRLDPSTGFPTGHVGKPYECGTPVCILF